MVLVFLQIDPPGQGLFSDELVGQYWPNTQEEGDVDRRGQNVPAAHTAMTLEFRQKDPAGQGVSETDPAGQKLPMLQASFDEGVEQ